MNENSAIWINTMDKQSGNRSATGRRGRRDGRVHEALRGRARPRRGGVLQGAGRGRRGARGAPHRRRRGLRGRLLRRRQEVAAGLGWAGLYIVLIYMLKIYLPYHISHSIHRLISSFFLR